MLTDQEIAELISIPKPLPPNFPDYVKLKPKRGHQERELGEWLT
jgi:hypothetical protein